MGDDPEDPSRVREDAEPSPPRTDGGSTAAIEDRVLPRFETMEGCEAVEAEVLPRFERPTDADVLATSKGSPSRFDGILPTFEEPNRAVPWETPGGTDDQPRAPVSSVDDGFGLGGPEYDEEMPLADHIEEMIKRLAMVVVVAGSVSLITWPFTPEIIDFLWYSMLPGQEITQPRVYGPLEFLLTRVKVASLVGLVVALPVVVYETYAFMRPGLYHRERKYYLAAIPTSLVLAVVGVLFAFFIVLPALFTYFLAYSQEAGEIAFALGRTFDLILILMGYLAIVFQIPLLIMLAIMIGVTSREWLADKRLYFWGAFLGLSFISSPDPTGMAPIIIALTMVGLFEGTLGLLKWIGR